MERLESNVIFTTLLYRIHNSPSSGDGEIHHTLAAYYDVKTSDSFGVVSELDCRLSLFLFDYLLDRIIWLSRGCKGTHSS